MSAVEEEARAARAESLELGLPGTDDELGMRAVAERGERGGFEEQARAGVRYI